ncbi:MAG: rhomboid family intramembrane serine protease [Phycisphaerae bacterium]|nr:rhomboid family intramembrane serine protease [Phycisphaerae bacterium]
MGLSDRSYAREPRPRGLGGLTSRYSFNTWLIIINVGVFLVQMLGGQAVALWIADHGHFSTYQLVPRLQFWRLITFQFLHASFLHLAMNMLGLWVFGGMVERHLGARKYAAFYLVCGIFGGVMYVVLNGLGYGAVRLFNLQSAPFLLFNSASTPLVGASAGVFGVIMACAFVAPNAMIQMIFPPVSLRMKVMAYCYVGLALFNLMIGGSNAGGDAAHIGGAIAGYFFIRRSHLLHDFFDVLNDSRKAASAKRKPVPTEPGPDQAELDRILAKIRAEGMGALTEKEKATLRSATDSRRSA